MVVLNALAPTFLIIALGAWMQRTGFASSGFLREANRITYWLGLPALLFSQLVESLHDAAGAEKLLVAMGGTTLAMILIGYGVAWLLRVPGGVMGTFVQGSFRGNLAFVGLPIAYSLPDVPVFGGLTLHNAAVIAVAPTMVLYNIAAVVVLTVSQHRFGPRMIWPVLKQLAMTPPLLATLAGIAFVALGWKLPHAIGQTLESLGEMALPLGLLGVGGSIMTAQLRGALRLPLTSAILKTWVAPVFAATLAWALGLQRAEIVLVALMAACPTAIISYAMALEMKGDGEMASTTIALSVFTSLLSLAVVVSFF